MTEYERLYELEQSDAHKPEEIHIHYPCHDTGECPYDAQDGDDCLRHCGLGSGV